MNDKEKKIDIIRKLIAKGKDPAATEAERESFLSRANKLMIDFAIKQFEINDINSGYLASQIHEFGRFTFDIHLAAEIIKKYWYVKVTTADAPKAGQKRWYGLEIFGETHSVEVAKDVFFFLLNSFDHLWVQHQIKYRTPAKERRGFIEGVAAGFVIKLESTRKESIRESGNVEKTGLALLSIEQKLAAKRDEYYQSQGMEIITFKRNFAPTECSDSTFRAGFEQGKNLNLNKKVGGKGQTQLN